jgi:hypothetical protein
MTSWFLIAACVTGDAPVGSVVLASDDAAVGWDDAFADPDGIGMSFPFAAEVLAADGTPLAGVRVEITSGWTGAWLLPADRAAWAPGEEDPCALQEGCVSGYDIAAEAWLYADDREGFPEGLFGGASVSDDALPDYLAARTDASGGVAFRVFVDTAPDSGASVPVHVATAADATSVEVSVDPGVVESLTESS